MPGLKTSDVAKQLDVNLEIFRFAVSDIAIKQPLPEEVAKEVQAYVGCISGALLIDHYRRQLADAGFADVVVDAGADLSVREGRGPERHLLARDAREPSAGLLVGVLLADHVHRAAHAHVIRLLRLDACHRHDDGPWRAGGLLDRYEVNNYAASVKLYAVRPKA